MQKHVFPLFSPFWVAQKRVFPPFGLSAPCRSVFFLFLAFLHRAEACFFSFWPFCIVQKRVFALFDLSASCRSVFFLFLAFLHRAEACFFSFWPFCAVQKRVFALFGLSASCRNKQKCKITCNITILYLFLQNKNDYEIFNFILHLVYNYQLFFYSKG